MFINSTFKGVRNQDAFFAITDASNYNEVCRDLWTPAQKRIAHDFADACVSVFPHSRVFRNYRKKYIAIKVERPTQEDLLTESAALLGHTVRRMDIEVTVTKNGLIFKLY
jgi:hypothetical protein